MESLRRSTAGAPPLHTAELSHLTTPNRVFAAVYFTAPVTLFYHHVKNVTLTLTGSFFPSLLLFAADLVLAFMWATTQAFRVRPIRRAEMPERLKTAAADLPAMDVFVCTADPHKEPPAGVANTGLSALAYDYPPEKLSVYVSDDGGSALTLFAFLEAAKFAAHWLPLCRRHDLLDRSPEAFFAAGDGNDDVTRSAYSSEAEKIKTMYESMKVKIENVVERGEVSDDYITGEEEHRAFSKCTDGFTRQDHPTVIQVILDKSKDRDVTGHVMPNLIYVSREKRKSSIHNFKAGALNALIRVSATMTNAPIILTLDCDMSSNDPQTPLRALCYFSDPKLESKLAYVQFPQRFKGINKNDIYGCDLKRINTEGMDGLLGPNYMGTGCFFKRRTFFGGPKTQVIPELPELGPEFVVTKPIQSPAV